MTVGIVLIDDHPLFTRGLELLLAATGSDLRVLGTTADAAMAVSLVARCHPDAALVDLAMPPPGGHDAIRAMRRARPGMRVIALSGVEDPDEALRALEAGADAFLPKSSEPATLVHPLRAVLGGCSVLPPELLAHLIARSCRPQSGILADLDDDERTVWRLVAEGAGTGEIARALLISERTAKRSVAALLRRIGAANRTHAAALAGQIGLLDGRRP